MDSHNQLHTPTEDWNAALPEHEPEPTWWPSALALGITLTAWGLITSWIMFFGGIGVVIISIVEWIREILHEQETTHH